MRPREEIGAMSLAAKPSQTEETACGEYVTRRRERRGHAEQAEQVNRRILEGGKTDVSTEELSEWMKRENEKAEQLAAFDAHKKAEAERQARQEKRDRLERYLRRREEAWTEHTGTPPPSGMRRTWTEEFVASTIIDEDVDLELRRARAAAEYDVW